MTSARAGAAVTKIHINRRLVVEAVLAAAAREGRGVHIRGDIAQSGQTSDKIDQENLVRDTMMTTGTRIDDDDRGICIFFFCFSLSVVAH
jgi:hypothetical protein